MKKIFLVIIINFLLLGNSVSVFAKLSNSPAYPDAGIWNTFSLSYALNKKYAILFTEEFRLKENYSRLNLLYTNIGLEYKINSYLKTSLVYRFIDKYMEYDRFSFRHRLMWDASIKKESNKFSLSYRHRLQVEKRNIYSSESGNVAEWYSRNKFEIGYAWNDKFSPYVAVEFRYQIFDPRNQESNATWHRIRYQAGVDYKISKKSKVGVYYLVQHEYNVPAAENLYITGLEYSLSLKAKQPTKKQISTDDEENPFK